MAGKSAGKSGKSATGMVNGLPPGLTRSYRAFVIYTNNRLGAHASYAWLVHHTSGIGAFTIHTTIFA
jgi:hypothetical protein